LILIKRSIVTAVKLCTFPAIVFFDHRERRQRDMKQISEVEEKPFKRGLYNICPRRLCNTCLEACAGIFEQSMGG
jgi:hypothetical protein